ncbi:MAG: PD-(D/E)XK nuclease domain-containing protein, partial [Deltaproteobacteria bacterium]|nr:PD-(D/E)XK nuclease domain-containing protein [Deltaproteobacteria bacterium]
MIAQYEGYYASVVFAYLSSPGLPLIVEDSSSKGRVDLTIILPDKVVHIYYEVDQPGKALAQIKEKGYHEKHLTGNCVVYLIGISFDAQERNITDF